MLRIVARGIRAVRLVWYLLLDRRVPVVAKLLPLAAVLYFLWPRDIVPDVVPLLGRVDDLLLLYFGISAFLRFRPRREAPQTKEPSGRIIEGTYRVVKTKPGS